MVGTLLAPSPAPHRPGGLRRHLYSLAGVTLAALFVLVFFTGRIDSKQLAVVAPRVGLQGGDLDAMVPRIAAQTGATRGTARRVVYLLACSGVPSPRTMEAHASRAAAVAHRQRMTPREATLVVLGDSPVEAYRKDIRDC